jgi:predicted site-specific integrase-resolvase
MSRSNRRYDGFQISGVRAISRALGIGRKTFYRWYQDDALPAWRLPDGRWAITGDAITMWGMARWRVQRKPLQQRRNVCDIK